MKDLLDHFGVQAPLILAALDKPDDHKHSCKVEGSFWLLYFTCRICGRVQSVDRDEYRALVSASQVVATDGGER